VVAPRKHCVIEIYIHRACTDVQASKRERDIQSSEFRETIRVATNRGESIVAQHEVWVVDSDTWAILLSVFNKF
jgi:dihydrodipicolinate reductase